MPETTTSTQSVTAEAPHSNEIGFMSPEMNLLILTWVTFIVVLLILHKFAWKPILKGLEEREKMIRLSVDEADRIKEELAKIEEKRKDIIREAEIKSREIIDQSRKAAVEAAKVIQQKAREETKIFTLNAQRELKDAVEKAQADLREESARIAVELAGKLIEENLDTEKNRKLINQFIKEV